MTEKPAHLSLFQLNQHIKHQLAASFNQPRWVIAEISDINTNRTGHCYLELIEKSADDDNIIAKARATIWSFTFRMLKPYFETTTGQTLTRGLKILVKVSVEFHEVFGMSLNISDIDPSYTMGDMARRRREIVMRLENEGVLNLNKELDFFDLPRKIAVISSPTAAGYEDFVNQLTGNPRHFKIYHKLFPAVMQGADAERSIISALDHIFEYDDFFDAVVIIRGGGSTSDLLCFDSYELAVNVAQFPLPIFTGIGHERDDSVVDMVAHTRLKTPTAVAEYIVAIFEDSYNHLMMMQERIMAGAVNYLQENKHHVESLLHRLRPALQQHLHHQQQYLSTAFHRAQRGVARITAKREQQLQKLSDRSRHLAHRYLKSRTQHIDYLKATLQQDVKAYVRNEKIKIDYLEKKSTLINPFEILKKGFTITTLNGKKVTSIKELQAGDAITTHFADGTVGSTVD